MTLRVCRGSSGMKTGSILVARSKRAKDEGALDALSNLCSSLYRQTENKQNKTFLFAEFRGRFAQYINSNRNTDKFTLTLHDLKDLFT